jgi:hypothetical protein
MQTPEQKLKLLNKTIETIWHGVSDTKEGDYPKIISLYKEVLKILLGCWMQKSLSKCIFQLCLMDIAPMSL